MISEVVLSSRQALLDQLSNGVRNDMKTQISAMVAAADKEYARLGKAYAIKNATTNGYLTSNSATEPQKATVITTRAPGHAWFVLSQP
jgi:hypothetical protein